MAAYSFWRPYSGLFPFLKRLFADGGYQGPKYRTELAKVMPQLAVEIVEPNFRTVAHPTAGMPQKTAGFQSRCRFVVQKIAALPESISY
jgi:hypothetical protein